MLTITDTLITSDVTDHQAHRKAHENLWVCTWTADRRLTSIEASAAVELAEIVSRGRDGGTDTTNYAYLTWQRVKELADILGVIPLKTVLYLEGLK